MTRFAFPILFVACFQALICVETKASAAEPNSANVYPEVQQYLDQRRVEFDQIPDDRKAQLKVIAKYIKGRVEAGETAKLTFICTHNSRRSHLGQIWAAVAANEQQVNGVETYSGGTEATAFNPRAISAIERAGLKVEKTVDGNNPKYAVRYVVNRQPLNCFSKVYSDPPNPNEDFCAVMTCSQADKSCPTIKGSTLRVAIPFEDPKVADNTPEEANQYDERCAQISREMLYLFTQVRN